MELLSDRNEKVGMLAISMLGQIGKGAQQARSTLQQIAKSWQGLIADVAKNALRQIDAS
jgi:hypothetical protein